MVRFPLFAAVFLLSCSVLCADPTPEVRQAIKLGLDAIQKKDYPLAERSFKGACERGGKGTCYDIGLAESKIPGRELRAICWFAAYLAANPDAANVAAVKEKIDALEAKSRDKILRLIVALQDAIRQMSEGDARDNALRDMVGRWARFGDYAAAQEAVDFIENSRAKTDEQEKLAHVYILQIKEKIDAGDMKAALQSLTILQKMNESISPVSRTDFWSDTAALQTKVARAQFKAGDAKAAGESIAAALKTTHLMENAPWPWPLEALCDIADAQITVGDMAGARKTLAAALPVAGNTHALHVIAQEQIRAGDMDAAQKTAGLIQGADARAATLRELTTPPGKRAVDAVPAASAPSPLPSSDDSALIAEAGIVQWTWVLENTLDASAYTAFPDFSDYKALADAIQNEPIVNGLAYIGDDGKAYRPPLDIHDALYPVRALTLDVDRMIGVQKQVDEMLKTQFKK